MDLLEATNYYLNQEIEYVSADEDNYDGDDDVYELLDQLPKLEKDSGINILRDKTASVLAVDAGTVVGALYTSFVDNVYSFDVIVHPDYNNQGIGTELTDTGISEFSMFQDVDTDAEMVLDVVSPKMEAILKKKGFVKIDNRHMKKLNK